MISNTAKSFDIPASNLNILHNYFDSIKLFSNLYLVKFLDISAISFFPYNLSNSEFDWTHSMRTGTH